MHLKTVLAWLLPLVLLTLAAVATLGVDLPTEMSIRAEILWQLRLPRLLLALTAGAGLAVALVWLGLAMPERATQLVGAAKVREQIEASDRL